MFCVRLGRDCLCSCVSAWLSRTVRRINAKKHTESHSVVSVIAFHPLSHAPMTSNGLVFSNATCFCHHSAAGNDIMYILSVTFRYLFCRCGSSNVRFNRPISVRSVKNGGPGLSHLF